MLNPNKSKLRHLTWIPEYNKIIAEPKMIGCVLKPYNSHGECNAQQNQVIVNTAACILKQKHDNVNFNCH